MLSYSIKLPSLDCRRSPWSSVFIKKVKQSLFFFLTLNSGGLLRINLQTTQDVLYYLVIDDVQVKVLVAFSQNRLGAHDYLAALNDNTEKEIHALKLETLILI